MSKILIAACLLLLAAGCGQETLEPVSFDRGATIPGGGGTCQELIGSRVQDVRCPPRGSQSR